MRMRRFEKRFVNGVGHSSRVAVEAERRLGGLGPRAGQRLLDVGCGNGAVGIGLARVFGLEVVGVDIDSDQIEAARLAVGGQAGVRFLVADATSLPFPSGQFDFVYTNKTTHHIRAWPEALAEMARVLKPGGRLIYSDFVAPAGHRLPTRRGIDGVAAANGLVRDQHAGSPFHYTAVLRAPHAVQPPLSAGRAR
jgi:ubiquinone/menaquinone biosynthesis C-methylase UbiE